MFSFHNQKSDDVPIAKELNSNRIIYLCPEDPQAIRETVENRGQNGTQFKCHRCHKCFNSKNGYLYHIHNACEVSEVNSYQLKTANEIRPLPSLNQRQVIYIAGPQGAGKSYIVGSYIYYWLKLYPDRKVIFISKHAKDETFQLPEFGDLERHLIRMRPNISWVEDKFKLGDFGEGNLVVFDDVTSSDWIDKKSPEQEAEEKTQISQIKESLEPLRQQVNTCSTNVTHAIQKVKSFNKTKPKLPEIPPQTEEQTKEQYKEIKQNLKEQYQNEKERFTNQLAQLKQEVTCVKQTYQQAKERLHQTTHQYQEMMEQLRKDKTNNQLIQDYVFDLIDDICDNGRHQQVNCLITSHALYNHSSTTQILNNMTDCVLFPQSSGDHHIRYLCKQYLGMSKPKIDSLNRLNSRWVLIHKNAPRYFMFDHGVMRFDIIE